MRLVKAFLVVMISSSVATLPAAGAEIRAHSPHAGLSNTQSDCCPQGEHCRKQANGECGKFAACALKCSAAFAVTLTPSGLTLMPSASEQSVLLSESPTSRSSNPPLPPPRV